MQTYHTYLSGWWYTYPSEKYESQLGWLFPIYGKINFMVQTTNQLCYLAPKMRTLGQSQFGVKENLWALRSQQFSFWKSKTWLLFKRPKCPEDHSFIMSYKRYEKRVRLLWIIEFCWWESPNPHDFFGWKNPTAQHDTPRNAQPGLSQRYPSLRW